MNEQSANSKTIDVTKVVTTEMTLETRVKNIHTIPNIHLRVSTEFLGGRFDTRA